MSSNTFGMNIGVPNSEAKLCKVRSNMFALWHSRDVAFCFILFPVVWKDDNAPMSLLGCQTKPNVAKYVYGSNGDTSDMARLYVARRLSDLAYVRLENR